MAGITISLLSNVRDVIRGAKQTEDALGDVADAIDDLSTAGKRSGRELGDGIGDGLDSAVRDARRQGDRIGDAVSDPLDDAARDARRQGKRIGDGLSDGVETGTREAGRDVDQLERKFRDLADATKRTDLDPGKPIARSTKQGMHEAGESVETFKDEAKSNLSEVASSFQGDMTSAVDLIQGTLGGIVSDLGPLGLAVGAAGAVGVGLIGAALQQGAEDAEEFQARVDSMTQEIVSEFTESGDAISAVDKKLREWATDNERYGVSLADLRKEARTARVDFGDLATTIANGTTKELRDMQRQVESSEEAYRRQAATVDTTAGADRSAAKAASEKASRLREDVLPAIKQQIEANENAQAAEEALADAQGLSVEQYKQKQQAQQEADEASEAAAAAEESRLEEQKAQLQEWADVVAQVYASAAESESTAIDNGAQNAEKYAAGLEQRVAAAQQFQANLQAIGEQLPGDLFDFVREQGPGFSQEIATYLAASPEQQARIQAGWKISAEVTADTTDVDKKTADKSKEKKAGPTSQLKGDTTDVDKKTDAKGKEKAAGPTVKLRPDDSAVDEKLAALRDRIVTGPVMKLRYDSSALDSYLARPRTITVNVRQGQEVK